jgi:hypothetical protein
MSSILPTDVQLFLSGEPKADARGGCHREPGSTITEPLNFKIFIHVFFDVNQDRRTNGGEEQPDVVSSSQVAAMFIDWTDPLRLSQAM